MKKISLRKLKIRPVINLSPETKRLFTWKELKGPYAVTFAALLGMVAAMLYEYYDPVSTIRIKTAAVLSTTLLIMGEMGTSEKFYLKTTLRVLGVIMGIALGMIYAVFEKLIEDYLEIPNSVAVANNQTGAKEYPNEWILITYRIAILTPTIFICCLLMKVFPKYSYALTVLAIHCPLALLAKTIYASLGITLSAVLAVTAAVISLILFDKLTTESLLMETNRVCINGVLSVFQLSVTGDPENIDQFLNHTDAVHKSISSAESAHETYAQWRAWTFRMVKHDFKALVKPTRPLFYQAYSLYWSNVAAYHATEYRADILFCNDKESYEKLFKGLVDDMVISIEKIKENLVRIYSQPDIKAEELDSVFDDIIASCLWNGMLRAQEEIKRTYLRNRKTAFTTFGQRWNMTDYLRQIAMMTLAFVDYMRAMTNVFQKEERRMRLAKLLEELAEALDDLRREEESAVLIHTRYAVKNADGGSPLVINKSSSSPDLVAISQDLAVEDESTLGPRTVQFDEPSETTSLLTKDDSPTR